MLLCNWDTFSAVQIYIYIFFLFLSYRLRLKPQRENYLGGLPKEMRPYLMPARNQRPKLKRRVFLVELATARGIMCVLLCYKREAVFHFWKQWGVIFLFKNYSNLKVKLTYLLNSWCLKTAFWNSHKVESSESLSEYLIEQNLSFLWDCFKKSRYCPVF